MFPVRQLVILGLAALGGFSSVSEALCGPDTSVPAKCYLPTTALGATIPQAYERAQAVVRIRSKGAPTCTGFLVGSEGHVLTANECIKDQDGSVIGVEFAAESASCADQCQVVDGCRGNIVANSTTFVAGNADIDYAILKLPSTVDVKSYGYLQLRESGAVVDEKIYMVTHQHSGMAKRIVGTKYDGSAMTVYNVNSSAISCITNATGVTGIQYQVDPNDSVGTPVLGAQDNTVLAIHNCGNCNFAKNIPYGQGMDVRDIIRDLKAKGVVIKDLVSESKPTPGPTTPAPTTKAPSTCKDALA